MEKETPVSREPGNEAVIQPSPEEKDYESAFLEASKEPSGNTPPEPAPVDPPVDKPPVNPQDDATPPPDEPAKPPDKPTQKPGESDEAYEQRWKTLQGIYQKEKSDWSTEKAQLLAEIDKFKKATPPQDTPAVGKKDTPSSPLSIEDLLTDEEKAELKDYESDFETVSKMEGLKRDKFFAKLEKKLAEFQSSVESRLSGVDQRISPVIQDIEIRTVEEHFSSIREAHSDFESLRDDGSIKTWIDSQPKFLKESLMKAYNEGETQDVIDLIATYKQANNITSQPPVDPKVVDINAKKEQKRAALQAVNSRRSPVSPSSSVATGYDDAFEEALRKS